MTQRKIPVYLTEAEWESVIRYLGRYSEVQAELGWTDTMAAVDSLRNRLRNNRTHPSDEVLENRLGEYRVEAGVLVGLWVLHDDPECDREFVLRMMPTPLSVASVLEAIGSHEREAHGRDFDPALPPL